MQIARLDITEVNSSETSIFVITYENIIRHNNIRIIPTIEELNDVNKPDELMLFVGVLRCTNTPPKIQLINFIQDI